MILYRFVTFCAQLFVRSAWWATVAGVALAVLLMCEPSALYPCSTRNDTAYAG